MSASNSTTGLAHSESLANLMTAILAVQQAVDHVDKTEVNPHYGNTYADLNSFLRALQGPMAEHKLVMTQGPGMEDGYIVVDTLLVHESGEWIRNRAAAPMPREDPQGAGSAITYLRRYSLAALFAVPQEDDDGNAASQPAQRNGGQRKAQGGGQRQGGQREFSIDEEVPFGKHKGKPWRALLEHEPDYVEWCVENMEKLYDETREGLRAALEAKEANGQDLAARKGKVLSSLQKALESGAITEAEHTSAKDAVTQGDADTLRVTVDWLKGKRQEIEGVA